MTNFKKYMADLEFKVFVPWSWVLGKTELVPVRNGKLAKTKFGARVGNKIIHTQAMAIDYYGLYKKTTSLLYELRKLRGKQVRMIEAPVVHFAAIRIEQISEIEPDLVAYFPQFKDELLWLRGFKD